MLRYVTGIVFLALSQLLPAEELSPHNSDFIAKEQAVNTLRNIAVALDKIYLHPDKARATSVSLISQSYTDLYLNGVEKQDFLTQIRSELIKGTSDTSIDLIEAEPKVTYSEYGEVIFKDTDGTVEVKIIDNDMGYLRIKGNATTVDVKTSIIEGFKSLLGLKAVIVDLTMAEKTDVEFVQQLLSLFVPENEILGQLVTRDKRTVLTATEMPAYEAFKTDMSVYIAQSSFVRGEWEFFSYVLQNFGKATIVGEESMGIDHMSTSILVGNGLSLDLPYARLTHPNHDGSWGEEGVVPDYPVSSDIAVSKALQLAEKNLNNKKAFK